MPVADSMKYGSDHNHQHGGRNTLSRYITHRKEYLSILKSDRIKIVTAYAPGRPGVYGGATQSEFGHF